MHETTRIFDSFGLPPAQRNDGTRPIQLHALPFLVATFCQTLATRFHLPPTSLRDALVTRPRSRAVPPPSV